LEDFSHVLNKVISTLIQINEINLLKKVTDQQTLLFVKERSKNINGTETVQSDIKSRRGLRRRHALHEACDQ